MNALFVSKTYDGRLRAEQAEATAARILDAVAAIFATDSDGAFSFDQVAARAGVSRRTVFRHFKDKDALLDAFWRRTNDSFGVPVWPADEADLTRLAPRVFAALDAQEALVRASGNSAAGRDLRLRGNDDRQAAYRAALADATQGLDDLGQRQVAAVVHLLSSVAAWQTMKDHWGLTGPEAGAASAWAVAALVRAARNERIDDADA